MPLDIEQNETKHNSFKSFHNPGVVEVLSILIGVLGEGLTARWRGSL